MSEIDTRTQEFEIRRRLADDSTRFIARFCKTPQTTSEIVTQLLRQKAGANRDLYERIVADGLVALESLKAITYTQGKWKTAEIALRVLEKYFGEKP
jgi:hypothetical protein